MTSHLYRMAVTEKVEEYLAALDDVVADAYAKHIGVRITHHRNTDITIESTEKVAYGQIREIHE